MNKIFVKKILILTVIILMIIGIVAINSTYLPLSIKNGSSRNIFIYKWIAYILLGIISALIIYIFLKLNDIKKNIWIYIIISFSSFFLLLPRIVSRPIKGAYRWINIGPISIQPSELIKPLFIIVLSYFMYCYIKEEKKLMFHFFFTTLLFSLCIILEKSNTSAIQYILIAYLMFLVSSVSKKVKFLLSGILTLFGLFGILLLYLSQNYAWQRIYDFFKEPPTQVKAAIFSIKLGGLKGRGIGEGLQKYFYLSEAHTDYIFSSIAEETGFLGAVFVIILFCFLIFIMFYIVFNLKDDFNKYIALGVAFNITNQFLLHIAINLSLLPSTGITLPFISYGGSSLVSNMMCIALLVYVINNDSK